MTPDSIDVSRAVAVARYFEALKADDEEARKKALKVLTDLFHKKTARLISRTRTQTERTGE